MDLSSHSLPLIITLHTQIQALAEFVEEIGTAVILASLHVCIGIIADVVLYLQPEQVAEEGGQFIDGILTVIDTTHFIQSVDDFNKFNKTSRPAVG